MQARTDRREIRGRIRRRIRTKLAGTAVRPRVAVFRSLKHIYVQAIDDEVGQTIAHVSTQDAAIRAQAPKGWNQQAARVVGDAMAEKLKAVGITIAVFDRGGYVYHGRVRALAEAMREAGLKL